MKSIVGILLGALLLFSCGKEEVDGFDDEIQMALDFKTDPQTGDTIYSLMMPSAFTPNGDGRNDMYLVYGTGISSGDFKMRVYNREGNHIFSSNDLYRGWSGAVMGRTEVLSQQNFTVQIDLTDTSGEEHHYNYRIMMWR